MFQILVFQWYLCFSVCYPWSSVSVFVVHCFSPEYLFCLFISVFVCVFATLWGSNLVQFGVRRCLVYIPLNLITCSVFLRRGDEARRPTPFTTPRRLWRTPRRRHTHIVRRCKLEFYILVEHIDTSFVANSWANVPFSFPKALLPCSIQPLEGNCMTIKEFSNQTHYQLLRIK